MSEPYYEKDGITIYCADSLDVIPLIHPLSVDLVLTDPPYGMGIKTNNLTRKRSALAIANDYPPVIGDDAPFDPSPLLVFPRLVVFGGNHFSSRLPDVTGWIVWDKLDGLKGKRDVGFNDNSDAELAWTNITKSTRIFRHRWMGIMKGSEHGVKRVHPTQKPIVLMEDIIRWSTKQGDMIFDPYMGSGSTLIAARNLGRRAIGVELSQEYCDVTIRRLG